MPCSQRKARILLKEKKAKIVNYNPFTIQLNIITGYATQEINVGVDAGYKHIGIGITSENQVLCKGEVELRDGISEKMKARSILRRGRRTKKLRHRPARWANRPKPENWLPPSIKSRINATTKWIDKFCSLLPNPKLHIEVAKFNIKDIINADETADGYYNVRYYVFARDDYTCQVCKKRNKILNTHHILYKYLGGTNRADNLITVCTDCHTKEAHLNGGILYSWMTKQKKVPQYKMSAFMNILNKRVPSIYPDARVTYGSETTMRRKDLGLEKTHYNDAIAVSGIKSIKESPNQHFYYKQFRKKKRSLHESVPVKGKNNKNITQKRNNKNVPFRAGVYLNDKVKYNGFIGWVYGFSAGRDVILRDLNEDYIRMPHRKVSKFVNMRHGKVLHHNNGWQFAMVG